MIPTLRFPTLALRRVAAKIDQGWSPVAQNRPAEDSEWAVLKLSAIKGGRFFPGENKALGDLAPRSDLAVNKGDVLITRANTPEMVGDVCIVRDHHDRLMLPDLIYRLKIDAGATDPRFLSYSLLSDLGRVQVRLAARGSNSSMVKLSQDQVKSFLVPSPDLDVQTAIADFLDRKIAAIDALIEKKERMIELLDEKRAALVHRAVTKGLDPDVPLKDSGIPWIGEIPAHWPIRRLKFVATLQRGFDLPVDARRDGEVPIIAGGGISGWHNKALVKGPGVVTGRYGTIGDVHLIEEDFWPLNTALYVKNFWGNLPEFVRNLLAALPITMFAAKAAVPGVDRNDLHTLRVGVPGVQEQFRIVEGLNRQKAALKSCRVGIQAQIDRLKEYRQALITQAVTGQLEIPEAA